MSVGRLLASVGVAVLVAAGASQAVTIDWADWTAADSSGADGTIGSVALDFTGTLTGAQLSPGTSVGTMDLQNYWTEGSPAPYTGNALVDNAPTANEMLAFNLASVNTLVFSSPVDNPIMAIVSQGRPGSDADPAIGRVIYDFDTPFTVLSEGAGFWGDGDFALGAGDQLWGYELHGVIQFNAQGVTSIGWTSEEEYWHGFTFGLAPQSVPDGGATLILFGISCASMARLRKRS